MTNLDTTQPTGWIGRTLVDQDGDKIGEIKDIYQDEDTGRPEWLTVSTGLFGSRVSFVPLSGATATGDDVRAAFTKDQVKDAPNAEADGHLSSDEEERLYAHYDMAGDAPGGTDPSRATDRGTTTAGTDRDTEARAGGDAMTRSEEEADIGTRRREAGRARLRKWVETEHVDTTVPVRHEEVRVEREPITDANRPAAESGPEISEDEHEVVLHDEEVVVDTHVEPKERIRLETDEVVEERDVDVDLRKERVDVDDEAGARGR